MAEENFYTLPGKLRKLRLSFFRPSGALFRFLQSTHGLRRGLHSCAASRLERSGFGRLFPKAKFSPTSKVISILLIGIVRSAGGGARATHTLGAMGFLGVERVFGEGAELFLFAIEAPATEDDAQTCHYGNGEVDSQDAGDFASGHDAEDGGQGM